MRPSEPPPPPMPDFAAVIQTTDAYGRSFWFDAHAVLSISRPDPQGFVELHFAGCAVESRYRVRNQQNGSDSVLDRWMRLRPAR